MSRTSPSTRDPLASGHGQNGPVTSGDAGRGDARSADARTGDGVESDGGGDVSGGLRFECVDVLDSARVARIDDMAHLATHADGVPPLSDHALLHVRYGGAGVRHLLLWVDGELAAYAHLDASDSAAGPQAELVVHPRFRAAGHGRALIRELQRVSGSDRLLLWAHGELPVARRLAEGMGFRRSRVLAQMRRTITGPIDAPAVPAGLRVRTFVTGRDEEAFVAVNNAAFAGHPEQGGWTVDDLAGRMREEWFDPAGLLLLDRDGELEGFVWTKVHGSQMAGHLHDPVGEIYVLGVAPAAQRHGLGRTLALLGLAHLAAEGLSEVMLYVDESNAAAMTLYLGLGFVRVGVDVLYETARS
jgi:mycothiol synthase